MEIQRSWIRKQRKRGAHRTSRSAGNVGGMGRMDAAHDRPRPEINYWPHV